MSKINKLGKSTFVIAILSFLLVAVLAFGGTYAYFSATTTKLEGSVTTGSLQIELTEASEGVAQTMSIATLAQPNQQILDQEFKADVTTNISYYVRVKFTVKVTPDTAAEHKHETETSCNDYLENIIDAVVITSSGANGINGTDNSTGLWYAGASAAADTTESSAYYYKLAPIARTVTAGNTAATTTTETFDVTITMEDFLGNYNDTADGCTYWQNTGVTISVTFEVLQAEYLTSTTDPKFDTDGSFDSATAAETAWTNALTTKKA